jgi:hypothetical protein
MAGWAVAVRNAILDKILRNTETSPFPISSVRVSLHTADPGLTGASEVAGGSYARQTPTYGAAASALAETTAGVDFTGMPACTVTHVSLWTDTGTFLMSGALSASKVVNAGDTFQLPTAELDVALSA